MSDYFLKDCIMRPGCRGCHVIINPAQKFRVGWQTHQWLIWASNCEIRWGLVALMLGIKSLWQMNWLGADFMVMGLQKSAITMWLMCQSIFNLMELVAEGWLRMLKLQSYFSFIRKMLKLQSYFCSLLEKYKDNIFGDQKLYYKSLKKFKNNYECLWIFIMIKTSKEKGIKG